jgi:hypothetical protein
LTATSVTRARRALGVTLRRLDPAAAERVRALVIAEPNLTHAQVAERALATYETVRHVRRKLGMVRPVSAKATPIGDSLLRGLHPRHVEALQRLGAAVASGSDMRTRAILVGPEMQQLITAARGASHA